MARKKDIESTEIRYLTDDELRAKELKEDKNTFLENLKKASSSQGFSAKRVREGKKSTPDKLPKMANDDDLADSVLSIPEKVEYVDDLRWEEIMQQFDELSPIDDITDEERSYYRRKSEGDKFDDLFKNERSMLSDVLTNVQKRSKIVDSRLNSMSGKGSYGISKNFIELTEAANSMDNTKLQLIKAMADLKKTAADLRMKDQKNSPVVEENNDSIADKFYKSIISGGTQKFMHSTMGQYGGNGLEESTGYNISQPLVNSNPYANELSPYNQANSNYGNMEIDDVDKYGYIRNENRNVDICVYRYEDGGVEFVALDEHGEVVHDYELPGSNLLDTLEIKPMSKYAYDKFQRKYRIVDVTSTVDLSDLDDNKYDDMDSDDKYDY